MPERKPVPVAQTVFKEQSLSHDESDSLYYNDIVYSLLLSYSESRKKANALETKKTAEDFFSQAKEITSFMVPIWYAMNQKVFTAKMLETDLNIPEPTAFRYMKILKKYGFIKQAGGYRPRKGPGGGTTIYATKEATKQQVQQLKQELINQANPGYAAAKRISQLFIDEYLSPRKLEYASHKEILTVIRPWVKTEGFRVGDLIQEVEKNLHFKGVRVIQ